MKRKAVPSYVLHQQSGRGRLLWADAVGIRQQKLLPGPFNSPESLVAKSRLELEIATAAAATPARSPADAVGVPEVPPLRPPAGFPILPVTTAASRSV